MNLLLAIFLAYFQASAASAAGNLSHAAFLQKLSSATVERTHHTVRYDPAYVRIPYPNGDIPADTGVCTDEVIRAYRTLGIDLQKEVHEDVLADFAAYPNWQRWLLAHADSNIDQHGRCLIFVARDGALPLLRAFGVNYESP
jgi:uncharacterized protein